MSVEPCEVSDVSVDRVEVSASPTLPVLAGTTSIVLTMDSGATANIIRQNAALHIGAEIHPTRQKVKLADNISHLTIVGEVHIRCSRLGSTN